MEIYRFRRLDKINQEGAVTQKQDKYQKDARDMSDANEAMDRSALGLSLHLDDSIELSCGVTIWFRGFKGSDQISLSVCAPRSIKILRCRHGNG